MTEKWRLIDNEGLSAATQMALDEVMLTSVGEGHSGPALRFLSFQGPTVLIGYNQDLASEARLDYCRTKSIETNRRLTGGGALYWGKAELGWEIIVPKDHPCLPSKIEDAYEKFCRIAATGLSSLGIDCRFRPRNDLVVGDRKISGTGATTLHGGFLFQGTVLVDYDVEEMIRSLRIPTEKLKEKELESVKERVISLRDCLGQAPSRFQIKEALASAFKNSLAIDIDEDFLSTEENELLAKLLPHYESKAHIDPLNRQRPARSLYGSTKTDGGIIRANIKTDSAMGYISQVIITGDFLVTPPHAIFALEAALKQVRFDPAGIDAAVRGFFAKSSAQLLRVSPQDFSDLLTLIVRKAKDPRLPVEPEQRNCIFPVAQALDDLENASYLLLPYCAKKPECEYRFKEGCDLCGDCDFGDAVRIARDNRLHPITILSYEHLCDVLRTLERERASGYLGCCCESFYIKHADRFNSITTPGLLIDIDQSTCFDLGKQLEAELGRFENHTDLKLNLLEQLADCFSGSEDEQIKKM